METVPTNYTIVYQWMLDDLKLSGAELLVYATIFGFTVSPRKKFYGTLSYLGARVGIAKDTAFRIINKLCSKPNSLLIKEVEYINGNRCCYYRAALNRIKAEYLDHIVKVDIE